MRPWCIYVLNVTAFAEDRRLARDVRSCQTPTVPFANHEATSGAVAVLIACMCQITLPIARAVIGEHGQWFVYKRTDAQPLDFQAYTLSVALERVACSSNMSTSYSYSDSKNLPLLVALLL